MQVGHWISRLNAGESTRSWARVEENCAADGIQLRPERIQRLVTNALRCLEGIGR